MELSDLLYRFNMVSSFFSWLTIGTLAGFALHIFTINSSTVSIYVLETITACLLAYNVVWISANVIILLIKLQNPSKKEGNKDEDTVVHFEYNAVGKAWMVAQVLIGCLHYYTLLRVRSVFNSHSSTSSFPDSQWTLWRPIGFLFIITFAFQTVYITYFWRFQKDVFFSNTSKFKVSKILDHFIF